MKRVYAHGRLWAFKSKVNNPYNKQLFKLKCSVFTEKSQTLALPYWLSVSDPQGLYFRFFPKDLTLS